MVIENDEVLHSCDDTTLLLMLLCGMVVSELPPTLWAANSKASILQAITSLETFTME